ncbi:MAG: LCP family protein, partial [Clostridiales bacterium]
MNRFRKQIFVSSICSSLILFIFGVTLLVFINKSDSQATGKLSNMLKLNEYTPLKEPINILLMGGDKSNGITDTIMVVNYNPKNSQISMLSIPRDTRAVYNRKNVKINSIYSTSGKGDYGCESLKGSVNNLLGIKIDYYVYIDVLVFRAVIDELGGIEYDV